MNSFFIIFNKIIKSFKSRTLIKKILKEIYPYVSGFYHSLSIKNINIKLVVPKNNIVDERDMDLAIRIFKSYKEMKNDQHQVNKIYKPSSYWQKHLDLDFIYLKKSYESNNLEKFLFFLQNFGNWNRYLGIENQTLIKKYSKNFFLRKFLINKVFYTNLKLWKFFNCKYSNLSDIHLPNYGNHNGALINNHFVVIGSFFNDIYSKIIKKYLKKKERNIFLDLGAGYGKLAYYILRDIENSCFIDLDIPEVLILASYYLSKCFPEKKIFLYGENSINDKLTKDYDLVFLPNWEIEKIKENEIEIVINKNSLGEMDSNAAKNYINHIHRISKYFFSMNHESFRNEIDGNFSLINEEYNLENKFDEIIRYPDLSHLIEWNKINFESDIFFYIFKKK